MFLVCPGKRISAFDPYAELVSGFSWIVTCFFRLMLHTWSTHNAHLSDGKAGILLIILLSLNRTNFLQ